MVDQRAAKRLRDGEVVEEIDDWGDQRPEIVDAVAIGIRH